jgi:hypothetical protein
MFFFEKKNQETFVSLPATRWWLGAKHEAAQKIKVFFFFSSEKKTLS